jgi:hypothetical protein
VGFVAQTGKAPDDLLEIQKKDHRMPREKGGSGVYSIGNQAFCPMPVHPHYIFYNQIQCKAVNAS